MKWTLFVRLCKSVNPWNSHAGLAPEANNIPNEIQVVNWGLIWSLHYLSDEQIFWNDSWNQVYNKKLINTLVRGTLDLFWLYWQMKLTQSRSQSFVPLDQRSENASSGSNHYERTKEITEFWLSGSLRICIYGACLKWLLPELAFSDRWSRGTKLWERDWSWHQTTSFPGSLFSASPGRWKKDPGCGWSRAKVWHKLLQRGRVNQQFLSISTEAKERSFEIFQSCCKLHTGQIKYICIYLAYQPRSVYH